MDVRVIITAVMWLHGNTRADMQAIETRLKDAINRCRTGHQPPRRPHPQSRSHRGTNEALATVAVRIALNPSVEDAPPAAGEGLASDRAGGSGGGAGRLNRRVPEHIDRNTSATARPRNIGQRNVQDGHPD